MRFGGPSPSVVARAARATVLGLGLVLVWPASTALAIPTPSAATHATSRIPLAPPPEGTARHPAIARRANARPGASIAPPQQTITSPGAVTGITTSPQAITPGFSQSIHDYVLRCAAGTNTVTFTVTSSGPPLVVSLTLLENQPVVVQDPSPTYWIRCLPHDFPQLAVSRPGNPTAGWYLTSNITAPSGASTFAMILDNQGTPVWYTQTASSVVNVELIPGTHTLAYGSETGGYTGTDPYGAIQLLNLDSQTMKLVSPPIPPMDAHDFLPMPNGDSLMVASPLRTNVPDVAPTSDNPNANMIDCVIEEVDPNGRLVWSWDAHDHLSPSENVLGTVSPYLGQPAADVYHCNSIDLDPTNLTTTGDLLVSLRSANAVVRINRSAGPLNGHVTWKLGGNGSSKDGAPSLTIKNDPETSIYGQHDARFLVSGDISLYDNHTGQPAAARGVEYKIDTTAVTATLVNEFKALDAKPAAATGSFRMYPDGDSVIGWGFKGGPSMTEVNAAGADQLDVTFQPGGSFSYRFIKVSPNSLEINTLRRDAGSQPFTPRSGVVLDGSGGLHPYGPDTVNTSGQASWPGWDIARGVVTTADASGGYTLDGWGGIHNFGTAPDVSGNPYGYWPGWDIARGIALCADGKSGYTADGWGGVHGFGGVVSPTTVDYWPGWDIVRGIVATPDCKGGYTLDGWGGIHSFGTATPITGAFGYWPGWDIARSIVLRPDGHSGYVLDGWGGVHGFGGVPDPHITAYWYGWDIARSITFAGDAQSGYVVDGYGGVNPFGAAAPATGNAYFGRDFARGAGGS